MGNTIYVGDVPNRGGAAKAAALAVGANTLTNITALLMDHMANVRREKLEETDRLINVGRVIGFENLGQKGLERIESGVKTQFPRDQMGNIVIPKDPERLLNEMRMKEAEAHPDTFFGRTQGAPSAVAVELEDRKIKANQHEAQQDRDAAWLRTQADNKSRVDVARFGLLSDIYRENAKPENKATDLYLVNGKIRRATDDEVRKGDLKPLTQGQATFYQGFSKGELEAIEKGVDINLKTEKLGDAALDRREKEANIDLLLEKTKTEGTTRNKLGADTDLALSRVETERNKKEEGRARLRLLESKSEKIALDMARLKETSPHTKALLDTMKSLEKAGDDEGARKLGGLIASSLIDNEPELKAALERSFGDRWWNSSWFGTTLERMYSYHADAMRKQIPSVLGIGADPSMGMGTTTTSQGGPPGSSTGGRQVLSTGREVDVRQTR